MSSVHCNDRPTETRPSLAGPSRSSTPRVGSDPGKQSLIDNTHRLDTESVFVTDDTHLDTLTRQLTETTTLIERTTSQFQNRHGRPMPEDNVWLLQRTAERDALARLAASMQATPGRAVQGAGSPSGPAPVSIDLTRHRKTQP